MFRQVVVAELFGRTRAAVSQMMKRHYSTEKVMTLYLIRELFGRRDRRGMRSWIREARKRADQLLERAREIEERRRGLRKTNADGLVEFVEELIEEVLEEFRGACRSLRRKWKILFDNEARSLLYKRLTGPVNRWAREHFKRKYVFA